jgi:hypothetical protein
MWMALAGEVESDVFLINMGQAVDERLGLVQVYGIV